ncbi:L,D-transpeptidase [Sulfuriflexus sp.]|uniref:L,D-transpeptidase n=1 Tax=Sulfuriflexus sp. TaxID=2015443 RepID=UPI0028CC166F|nr:L,D-transpeptidase [Sulfuriflexus sp.]MDT8403710.1 L,D-transpeptidase [Sulfuriflexus sp.]
MNDSQDKLIKISIARQRLQLWQGEDCVFTSQVATATNGPGEQFGSECTPRGGHIIRAKIGAGCVANTVFIARRPSGEIYSPALRAEHPQRDWILSRILWLSGTEPGRNRLGKVDTMRRYIYIHGCPDEESVGSPGSHGCIRMRNADVIALFDLVDPGTPVFISED